MPKVSTSSHGKKRSKDRASGRQYPNAALIRKLRKSRFKGIVEVIEPAKPRQFERTPNLKANSEENWPFSVPIIQAELYAVNLKKPRVIISATAKWKQAAATKNNDDSDDDNDNDNIDVDKNEDAPAGFVDDVAEMLGKLSLVNAPAAHTPYPAPPHQFSHTVPEPMLVELVNDNGATNPPKPSTNHFYLGSTDDDVDMTSAGEAMMEPPDYSVPMKWTSQPEHEILSYSQVGQVADNIMHNTNIQVNLASMLQPMQLENESMNHMNLHPIDPLAFRFQETFSRIPGTSQSPATAPEIINTTSGQGDEQRPNEEPGESTQPFIPIHLNSEPDGQQHRPHNNLQPFPHLIGCKNMKCITMSGESEASRTIWHGPGHRRLETPPDRSDMDLAAHLKRVELAGHATPQAERRKQRRRDSQPEFACAGFEVEARVLPRQRRRCQTEVSKLKTLPIQKRSGKHQQHQASMEGPASSTEWNFSRFLPSITSLVDRFLELL